MVLNSVIVDVTIPRRSFVFGQSRAKVSAGFTNVRSVAVAAFDLVYCSLIDWDSATSTAYVFYRLLSTSYFRKLVY